LVTHKPLLAGTALSFIDLIRISDNPASFPSLFPEYGWACCLPAPIGTHYPQKILIGLATAFFLIRETIAIKVFHHIK